MEIMIKIIDGDNVHNYHVEKNGSIFKKILQWFSIAQESDERKELVKSRGF